MASSISIRLMGPGRPAQTLTVLIDEKIAVWKERTFPDEVREGRRINIVHFGQRLPDHISFRQADVRDGD
ncbi:hypothetical protein BVRB_028220, partial [Beta vulgaris subsp. vulgaris]